MLEGQLWIVGLLTFNTYWSSFDITQGNITILYTFDPYIIASTDPVPTFTQHVPTIHVNTAERTKYNTHLNGHQLLRFG